MHVLIDLVVHWARVIVMTLTYVTYIDDPMEIGERELFRETLDILIYLPHFYPEKI
jgi:hypothetical protein